MRSSRKPPLLCGFSVPLSVAPFKLCSHNNAGIRIYVKLHIGPIWLAIQSYAILLCSYLMLCRPNTLVIQSVDIDFQTHSQPGGPASLADHWESYTQVIDGHGMGRLGSGPLRGFAQHLLQALQMPQLLLFQGACIILRPSLGGITVWYK